MQDPWNHIEYAKAEMPDGRLLLIERERAPRLSRHGQVALHMGILITAAILPWFVGPVFDLFFFAGLWSGVPLVLAWAVLALLASTRAEAWAAYPPDDPEVCRVIGANCSTGELRDIMRCAASDDTSPWRAY